MKKVFLFIFYILIFIAIPDNLVFAHNNDLVKGLYEEQLKESKADEIRDLLPSETLKDLDDIGVNSFDFKDLINIKFTDILRKVFDVSKTKVPYILKPISFIFAIILLNAIFTTFESSFNKNSLNGVIGLVSNLCLSMTLISPICEIIKNADLVISNVSKLLAGYIPIMGGIILASGKNITAFSYSSFMILVGNLFSNISTNLLVPFLNCYLAFGLSTSLSSKLNLTNLNNWFLKTIKWILGLITSIFVGSLTIKSIVANSTDFINNKTMKFLFSGCIPIVGSAIGDAFSTVYGCINLLKSGVGAFFILALIFIFLPIILECSMFIISINFCSSFGEIFGLDRVSKILNNAINVLKVLLAIIIFLLVVLVVTTAIVLVPGGN